MHMYKHTVPLCAATAIGEYICSTQAGETIYVSDVMYRYY